MAGKGRPRTDAKKLHITLPGASYARFQRLAKLLDMDVATAIRMCASLQLAQLEVTVVFPQLGDTPEDRERRTTMAASEILQQPELTVLEPEPEPKPFGFGSRSEADGQGDGQEYELVPFVAPVVAVPRREYTGYMKGL